MLLCDGCDRGRHLRCCVPALGAVPSGARRHQRMVEEGDLTLPPPRGSFVSRHKLALIGCAGCSLIVVGAVYRRHDLASIPLFGGTDVDAAPLVP